MSGMKAKAYVYYVEYGGKAERSTKFEADSIYELMDWLVSAVKHYQSQMNYDAEYSYVSAYVINYEICGTRVSMQITRKHVDEFPGFTSVNCEEY